MPFVPPIVGYFGRTADDGTGQPGGLRVRCVTCADKDPLRKDADLLFADTFLDSGGDGRCETCGHLLTDDPKQLVHVDWGTKPEHVPAVRRPNA